MDNPEIIFCPKCGSKEEGNTFCSKCGNKLANEEVKKEPKNESSKTVKKEKMVEKKDSSSKNKSKFKKIGFGCSWGCLCMILTFLITIFSTEYLGADVLSGFVGMFLFIAILLPIYIYTYKEVGIALGIIERKEKKERPLQKGINKDIEKFEKRRGKKN